MRAFVCKLFFVSSSSSAWLLLLCSFSVILTLTAQSRLVKIDESSPSSTRPGSASLLFQNLIDGVKNSLTNYSTPFPVVLKIVGGHVADKGEFPFQLSLRFKNKHICGAVIIDQSSALTAAHCVDDYDETPFVYSVAAGKLDLTSRDDPEEQIVRAVDIKIHPRYDPWTMENDIAHLTIEPLTFNERVRKIDLFTGELQGVRLTPTASGWGDLTQGGQSSPILRAVDLPIIPNEQCHEWYQPSSVIKDTMLCAGRAQGGIDTCQGDSGGPLILRDYLNHGDSLIGLTSWSRGCGQTNFPGVYTRVSKFREWVEQVGGNSNFPNDFSDDNDEASFENLCGGLVLISKQTELTYQNLGRQNTGDNVAIDDDEITCTWILWPEDGGLIGLSLIDLDVLGLNQTNSSQPDATLSIQNGFSALNAHTTLSRPLTNHDLDGTWIIREDTENFLVVVFTSSRQGQKFNLRLRTIPKGQLQAGPTNLKPSYQSLHYSETMGDGLPSNYSHPESSSTLMISANDLPDYEGGDRHFVIVQGHPGKKLSLSINFVDTEADQDLLKIYKFSQKDGKFLFLETLDGPLGQIRGHNFESDANQQFFLYFKSDQTIQGDGFKLSYSYHSQDLYDATCGGLIQISMNLKQTLAFKNKDGQEKTCIWLINGPVKLMLVNLNWSTVGQSGSNHGSGLTISNQFTSHIPDTQLTQMDVGHSISRLEEFTVVTFRSMKMGQNFCFDIKKISATSNGWFSAKLQMLTSHSSQLNYPPFVTLKRQTYPNNDRQFFVIPSDPGHSIELTVDYIDTEIHYDELRVYKFSQNGNKFELLTSLSGRLHSSISVSQKFFEGDPNQPILLYFHSDVGEVGTGFQIFYGYRKIRESSTQKAACGGYLDLTNEVDELSYKNENFDNHGTKNREWCVWVIHAPQGGPIGLTMTHFNMTLDSDDDDDEPDPPGVILQYGFSAPDSIVPMSLSYITTFNLNKERVISQSIVVLTSRSRPGQDFHLKFRDLATPWPGNGDQHWNVNATFLSQVKLGSEGKQFLYPLRLPGQNGGPEYFRKYEPLERQFFILKPAHGQKVSVEVTFVDLEMTYDHLNVFTMSKKNNGFLFDERFTGENVSKPSRFEGATDRPILLYFHSDFNEERSGFRFSYCFQPREMNFECGKST